MATLYVVALGKLKESFWRDAEAEYRKRLRIFSRIEVVELREESFTDKEAPERVRAKEGEKIRATLKKISHPYVIALDERGVENSSIAFADFIKKTTDVEQSVVFIVGGPLGLDPEIRAKAQACISLSRATFTHQMARVILWEQIYRAYMIINKKPYHH